MRGTASPRPVFTFRICRVCRLERACSSSFNADRHLPVGRVELGKIGIHVAERGDPDHIRQAFGRHAKLGGDDGTRRDLDLRPVERRTIHGVGKIRHGADLARELRRGLDDLFVVGAGHLNGEGALPISLNDPGADIGNLLQIRADDLLKLALGQVAFFARRIMNRQRRLPDLLRASGVAQNPASVDENGYAPRAAAE